MLAPLVLLLAVAQVRADANTHWFSFGDSYTTTGFNYTLDQPNDANPIGNPALPGNSNCGRRPSWTYLNTVKYNTTQLYTYNFAYGGATIDRAIVPPSSATILTVGEQLNQFQNGYTGDAPLNQVPWTGANSLFSTFIGINDIGRSYLQDTNHSALHDRLMASYTAAMQRIYDFGGRNFLFLNVPPTDRSPTIMSRGAADAAKYKSAVLDYNAKLDVLVTSFKESHSDVSTWLVDTHAAITKLLDDPTQYGFRDATTYGSAEDLIWCNNYHISPAVHDYLAQEVQAALNGTGLL
ncbi:hypothetical protein AURDEDRAFT_104001 [Auricularia subglabra TFB-10046 SS5]|nr:hypothetical protein AURDEDRAFT_104001 [Auricularia subglabra TFB-10046 SS5]